MAKKDADNFGVNYRTSQTKCKKKKIDDDDERYNNDEVINRQTGRSFNMYYRII